MGFPISGKNGSVVVSGTVALITKWSLTKEANTVRYASNETQGFKRSVPGIKSASGTIDFKLDTSPGGGQIVLAEGGTGADMKLYINNSKFWEIPSTTFKNFKVEVDINDGTVISGSADFESDGQYNEPSY